MAKLKCMCKKGAAKRSRGKKKFPKSILQREKKVTTEVGFEPNTSGSVSVACQLLSQMSTLTAWHI